MENDEKLALITIIEKLVESDLNATPTPLALLHLLELEDLIAMEQSLLKSKANRSKENEAWFDELCKK
jgi:hypothetical protein